MSGRDDQRQLCARAVDPIPPNETLSLAGLNETLRLVNGCRAEGTSRPETDAIERCVEQLFGASHRLAVYGSLAPGRENHHLLADIRGHWFEGCVRGHLQRSGWGSELGYPALRWDPEGPEVAVWVLTADALERRWPDLDRFEGPEYFRGLVPVFGGSRLLCVTNLYLAV